MKNIPNKKILLVAIIGAIIGLSLQFSDAVFNDATVTAPGGNISAPLNTTATAQSKSGTLTVGGLTSSNSITASGVIRAGAGNPVSAGDIGGSRLCIGSDCRNSWPSSGGSGTVTNISQGTGIILSPNPITTSGSVSVDANYLQRRVSSACPAGRYLTAIAADGTPTCTAPASATCTYGGRTYTTGATCMQPCAGSSGGSTIGISKQCLSDGTWTGSGMCNPYSAGAC